MAVSFTGLAFASVAVAVVTLTIIGRPHDRSPASPPSTAALPEPPAALSQSQPRPTKPNLDRDFPNRLEKPVDTPYGPYADGFERQSHVLGPFPPIRAATRRAAGAPLTQ